MHIIASPSTIAIPSTMVKKALSKPSSPPLDTHTGLLQKSAAAGTSAKWSSSPGQLSKKLQANLFGSSAVKDANKEGMLQQEVLLDGSDIYPDGVPAGLEERYFRYIIHSSNSGKTTTFNLSYLQQCIKHDGNEWISLPDDSELLANVSKELVMDGHVRMRAKQATIREYSKQRDNVLKASIAVPKLQPWHPEDVEVRDIIEAANGDRDKGWASYDVLRVSSISLIRMFFDTTNFVFRNLSLVYFRVNIHTYEYNTNWMSYTSVAPEEFELRFYSAI